MSHNNPSAARWAAVAITGAVALAAVCAVLIFRIKSPEQKLKVIGPEKFTMSVSPGSLQNTINVKTDCGAKGNGTSDDTKAVQSAVSKAGGGIVYFPKGVYIVGDLSIPGGTVLTSFNESVQYSGGAGSVVLTRKAGAKSILNFANAGGCTVEGILFQGSGKTGVGLYGSARNLLVQSCKFYQLASAIGDGGAAGRFAGITVDGCCFDTCATGITNISNSTIADNFIYSCDTGIALNGSGNSIKTNKIEWNNGCGIMSANSSQNVISGNIFDRNGYAGLYLGGGTTQCSISGNVFRRNGALAVSDMQKSQMLISGADTVSITGNETVIDYANDNQTGPVLPSYALYCVNSSNVSVVGNDLLGYTLQSVYQKGNSGFLQK